MPLVPRVNEERTCRRIHRSDCLRINDIFQLELTNIVPMAIICVLTEQGYSSLGIVGIELRHVEVIDEVD